MKLSELLKDINAVNFNADGDMEITGAGCDSSNIRQGELFVAIEGQKTDGHKYIEDAVSRGASCVICQKKPRTAVPYIIVEDSKKAFALVSAAWFGYPGRKLKLIGVTGTNGKTTVTHLIKHIIEECSGCKTGLIGTIGNLIGERELEATLTTPGAYELQYILSKMVFEGCRYAVMEVSSHALSLDRVYGLEYEIGIFTNLTPEHLDFHPSMEEYAAAKSRLFQKCRTSIINIDDKYADLMLKSSTGKTVTYSAAGRKADFTASDIGLYPGKTEFDINAKDINSRVTLHIPGMFSVYNALAAATAGILLGFEAGKIKKALFNCNGVRGRAEVLPVNKEYTVLVDYAHTPDALENIIKTARTVTDGRVLTVFGCGGDRDKTKRPVMGKIASQLSDIAIITSDNPRTEDPMKIIEDILDGIADKPLLQSEGRLKVIENRREAIYEALNLLLARDVLVIAGKGHETYQILGSEKTHFDDREAVEQYMKKAGQKRYKEHVLLEGLS